MNSTNVVVGGGQVIDPKTAGMPKGDGKPLFGKVVKEVCCP
jgi:hypothetical protein